MADDILEEVEPSEVPRILEVLKKGWPQHFVLHQFITIMEELKKVEVKHFEQALYRYGKLEDGVYVVRTTFDLGSKDYIYFFVYTVSEDTADLSKALMETTRIPWQAKNFVFEITFLKFVPTVLEVVGRRGVGDLLIKVNLMLVFPAETTLQVDVLPEDVYLDYLDESHVLEMDKNWPHRFPGSVTFLSKEVKGNFGIGLFRKSDSKMLSSAASFQSGGIFILFTDDNFRGKGYAGVVIRAMVQEIRNRGRIPFATIIPENTASLKLFRKIGFVEIDTLNFIFP